MMEQMEEWEMAAVHNCASVDQSLQACCITCPLMEACHGEVDVVVIVTPRRRAQKPKRTILTLNKEHKQ